MFALRLSQLCFHLLMCLLLLSPCGGHELMTSPGDVSLFPQSAFDGPLKPDDPKWRKVDWLSDWYKNKAANVGKQDKLAVSILISGHVLSCSNDFFIYFFIFGGWWVEGKHAPFVCEGLHEVFSEIGQCHQCRNRWIPTSNKQPSYFCFISKAIHPYMVTENPT